ncbi:MAG: Mur ligase family protein [Thermomicrobiales bacterium]
MTGSGDYEAYQRGHANLNALIRGERAASRTAAVRRARALRRLERTRQLLGHLGHPQDAYLTVHVTGTSGKGSTSAILAAMLTAAGYRVGLRTSPYLQVATEKLQIGSRLIDGPSFAALVDEVEGAAQDLALEPLVYTEAWATLSYLAFARRAVDVAIIEVGAGGRFDATNVITPTVSVITSVGMDHVVSLGPTLADIAWHKAGIIKPGRPVVIGTLPAEALKVVRQEAAALGAFVRPAGCANVPLAIGMPGAFQATNAAVALEAVAALREYGLDIPLAAEAAGIAAARLPGRLERMPGDGPAVWLDGAHNADKMAALIDAGGSVIGSDRKPVLVTGMLASKDAGAIAGALAPAASAIVTTEPQVLGKTPLPPEGLARALRGAGYGGALESVRDSDAAVQRGLELARELGASVLVTGSLYLIGEVRRRWYPDACIVTQRTPWPVTR